MSRSARLSISCIRRIAALVCAWVAIALPAAALAPGTAAATQAPPDLGALARQWDYINFEIKDGPAAEAQAEQLQHQAEVLAQTQPNRPEPLIWQAAALLAKADARRNLSSLPLADKARKLLERAAALGASGDDGGFAYAVLGTLYGEMPGFPLGFGDKDKARADFQRASALAPANVEVNVLYGDFLLHQRDFAGAAAAAKRALNAPARVGRPLGDRRRHEEALALLAKAERGQDH